MALKIGQIETAIAALQEANQADPLNPQIQRCLTEAYDAAGLTENAFQAARAAVLLAPDDIDLLTWFAGQALELASHPGVSVPQAQVEAISALSHAALLAPNRSDLLVRLGQVQVQSGDIQAARGTFNRLAHGTRDGGQGRNVADLYQAAKNLLRLGDAAGAVSCLELALQSKRRPPTGPRQKRGRAPRFWTCWPTWQPPATRQASLARPWRRWNRLSRSRQTGLRSTWIRPICTWRWAAAN